MPERYSTYSFSPFSGSTTSSPRTPLSALAAFWLPHAPARARNVFLFALLAGFTLGWVQQMRGQHFLSHTLWTAWLSSALIVALFALFARPLGLASSSPAATQPKLVEARP